MAYRKCVNRNKFFPKQRTALDDMISQERKEKEAANSTSPATTDEEPVVIKTKLTVQPIAYASDSSSTDATYKIKNFSDAFPEPVKVPKSLGGIKVKSLFQTTSQEHQRNRKLKITMQSHLKEARK